MCKLRNNCTSALHFLMINRNFDLDSIRKQCRKDETKSLENFEDLVNSKIDLEIETI